jgi:hypothetical protein
MCDVPVSANNSEITTITTFRKKFYHTAKIIKISSFPKILLDNRFVCLYSVFAFRVNKDKQKTQKTASLDGFIIAQLALK